MTFVVIAMLGILLCSANGQQQVRINTHRDDTNFFRQMLPDDSICIKAGLVTPTPRQLAWQKLEFIAFAHFNMNTFTDREWGEGTEDPALFNPVDLDAKQWVSVCKSAGIRMIILTAKHHDGFCLWPTKYTNHSVRSSPWRSGKGDVVGELAAACKEGGLKFGVYLSPWDRNNPVYGDSPRYNELFRNQLRELLTSYGEVSEVWLDGACGEGPNGKRQEYDWQSYYSLVRELQPNTVISVMGPDVRWVGTESGYARETEWSVVPFEAQNPDSIASQSQKAPLTGAFIPRDMTDENLGGRDKIINAKTLAWYPAETNVSIRPGWFYHETENELVKSPENLVDIYYNSAGRNSVLLLNIPPDKRGRIHKSDSASLIGMKTVLEQTFRNNLADSATVLASSFVPGNEADNILDPLTDDMYWTSGSSSDTSWLELKLNREKTFDRAMLKERIQSGQRVEEFQLESWHDAAWKTIAKATTIGYKRLMRFPSVTTDRVRIVISKSRGNPTLSGFGLFKAPPIVEIKPAEALFVDSLLVTISCDDPTARLMYAVSDSVPNASDISEEADSARLVRTTSKRQAYRTPFTISSTCTITAAAIASDGKKSLPVSAIFKKDARGVVLEKKYSRRYSAGGLMALVDVMKGSEDLHDGRWQGYEGDDLEVVIDLGKRQSIHSVSAGFLQNIDAWIFMPSFVAFSVSDDGTSYPFVKMVRNDIPVTLTGSNLKEFVFQTEIEGRFVKIRGKNIGKCPPGHPGAGKKAWLFVDEVTVK